MKAPLAVLSGALAGLLLAAPAATQARVVEFDVEVAPPAERVEVVPAPRHGYVYEKGYWSWDNGKYAWREGRFIEERPGHRYEPGAWERRGEHWHFRGGHWDDD